MAVVKRLPAYPMSLRMASLRTTSDLFGLLFESAALTLLRVRRERPCGDTAAEKRDELPPPHWLILSLRITD